MRVGRHRAAVSNKHSASFVHGCRSRIGRTLEDENIARRPTRKHGVADVQRVTKEVVVDDVGDELFARRPFNRDLYVGTLIFDRMDLADKGVIKA